MLQVLRVRGHWTPSWGQLYEIKQTQHSGNVELWNDCFQLFRTNIKRKVQLLLLMRLIDAFIKNTQECWFTRTFIWRIRELFLILVLLRICYYLAAYIARLPNCTLSAFFSKNHIGASNQGFICPGYLWYSYSTKDFGLHVKHLLNLKKAS